MGEEWVMGRGGERRKGGAHESRRMREEEGGRRGVIGIGRPSTIIK